ncbi:DNA repair protein RAD16 [Heracleum sosnowskyi]|uniref:DNA repair protein RAD16 n=1 Tax=Heracleum sosnowskyi TaxID=360622 RepID=A0AAD8GSY5_9APIA|nr:DNA repair protein RAD16 [Heracleum sosnowskyi]
MNPKPNPLPAPIKGDDNQEIPDSDYDGEGKEGHDVLRMTEENVGQSDLKLDLESKTDSESSDAESFETDSDQEREDSLADGVQDVPESVETNIARKKRKRKKNRPTLMWEVWEEEHARWLASHEEADIDLDIENQDGVVAETAEAPPTLIMPLLRYQKEWLAWALQQEESAAKGGILADEMGMGKTVQAIALVLAKQEFNRAVDGALPPTSSSSELPQVKATLVICPLVAVVQWVSEISRFTLKGSNKVLVYHGAKRGKTLHEFSDYDFVITTYSIVEAEYRKYVLPPKEKCNWCGKSFCEQKITIHQLFFCGPNAITSKKPSKQRKSKEPLKKGKHYDKDKACGSGSSAKDSGAEKGLCERNCNLHSMNWNRIILDEAHYIKDRRGNTTKAVLALNSSYKWALSGTPLQNRVGELYSLIRFLQVSPYSFYFCKDCDCRTLDYSSKNECSNCPHASVRHFCWWNKHIATPVQSRGQFGSARDAMILLKHKILKSVLLRRTKKGRSAELALPPKMMLLRRDSLDIKEEDYYTSLYNESRAQFNTYVTEGTVMNNYAHIFDLLTRLRQAVNHPYLVVYSKTAMSRNPSVVGANNGEGICGLCDESVEDPVVNACTHVFCKACLNDFSASAGQFSCPTCKEPLTADFSAKKDQGDEDTKMSIKGFKRSSILNRIQLDDFQTSTKIEALREEIRFMVERDGSAKGIVFSQFTSFLDLIHYSLQKSGVQCVQLDGSMTMKARDAVITRFNEDPDCRLFLMSLKAGGVALNLTVASHVFLMDPWWNPAVERQAQDRIHRIGQFKPIRVVRFVIEGTIEERILTLQEKKELVFEGTVGGMADALGKLTENDMKFLFVT